MTARARILAPGVDRGRLLAYAAAIAVVSAVAMLAFGNLVVNAVSGPDLRAWVAGFGPLAPVAFVLAQATQVVVAPIPGQAFAFAAGYLFGPWMGLAYSLLGATIGTYVAVKLARVLGREHVARLVDDDALARLDALVDRRGLLAALLVFLVPGVPDDVVCFTAGLLGLDARDVAAVSIVGRLPGYFLLTTAGAGVATEQYGTAAALLGVTGVATLLAYQYRDRIYRALDGSRLPSER